MNSNGGVERVEDVRAHVAGGFVAWCVRHRTRLLLAAILLLGIAVRLPGLFRDLPFTYYGDEAHLVKRSMVIASGDLNPHWFNKPALLMYVLAFVYGVMYLVGSAFGAFESPEHFAAWYLDNPGAFIFAGRLIVCIAGVASIYLVYRIARKLFRSDPSALAAAGMAAVLGPLVFGSQQLKADVPCAALILASLWLYLRSRESGRWRDFLLAGLVGGFAVGTKYYGVILIPALAVGELLDRSGAQRSWRAVLGRVGLLPVLFALGFFIASAYHFLDPTWSAKLVRGIRSWVDPSARVVQYDPDSQVKFETGPSSLGGATAHFIGQFISPRVVGFLPSLLMLLGIVGALCTRATRRIAAIPLVAVATFILFAVTLSAYHTNFRHLAAILPLLCLFALPPSRFLRPAAARAGLVAVLLASVGYECYRDIERNDLVTREDSRNRAHAWIVAHIGPDDRVLLDDYGPQLSPNRASLARTRARLKSLPADEAFTASQDLLLRIQEKYPSPVAKNLDRLGHPWWLAQEITEAELLSDRKNREASNPLVPRFPQRVDEYRRLGVDYVITNSLARDQYFDGSTRADRFPSWKAFYEALHELKPVHVFDPGEWGGKGPVVWVYRLGSDPHDDGGDDKPSRPK